MLSTLRFAEVRRQPGNERSKSVRLFVLDKVPGRPKISVDFSMLSSLINNDPTVY